MNDDRAREVPDYLKDVIPPGPVEDGPRCLNCGEYYSYDGSQFCSPECGKMFLEDLIGYPGDEGEKADGQR